MSEAVSDIDDRPMYTNPFTPADMQYFDETDLFSPSVGPLGTTNIITTANTSPSSDPLHSNINHTHSLTPTQAPSATVFTKAPLPNAPNQPTPQQSTMPSQQPFSPFLAQIPKIVINSPAPQLTFDEANVDLFFQRFESRYRHEHLNDAELFDKLLQCLNYAQQCRMHCVLSTNNCSYVALKDALFHTYGRSLEKAQEDLAYAPELGDKLPSEMLAQLRSILGRHLKTHPLLEHSLRREFLHRIPTYARDLLTLMDNPNLDQMAAKADLLVNDRKRRNFLSAPHRHYTRDLVQHDVSSSTSVAPSPTVPLSNDVMQALSAIQDKLNAITSLNVHTNIPSTQTPLPQHTYRSFPPSFPSHATQPRLPSPSITTFCNSSQVTTRPSIHNIRNSDMCWYHTKFGPHALRCSPGCKFYASSQHPHSNTTYSRPLNSRGGAPPRAPQVLHSPCTR